MQQMLLFAESGKSYLVKDVARDFHTEYGFVRAEELSKAKPGDELQSNTGKKFIALKPSFMDAYRRIRRGPQIIPLKDIGSIISETGINRKSVVLDAGTGSGALACFLGNLAKKVISYELRDDFADVAQENVLRLGLKNVSIKRKNIYEGCEEKGIDLAVLDLPEPWKAIATVTPCIRPGGFLVSYSPTIPQVMDFVEALKKYGKYIIIKTIEISEREWEIEERKVRPLTREIGHSGFLTYARRL